MEIPQLLFIGSIICFAIGFALSVMAGKPDWKSAGLCLFSIAIMMA